ncbi:hypothetical protein D915_005779 [Fasciola hepatica]|uniref:Kinesin motor domain-containing protein n=1 Tax=Fasciola hepatica TaxID=6192 RepID=A0A4E0R700_FASHE|nr:hypothetical protein D915_005779 [Fasciola hepatica]
MGNKQSSETFACSSSSSEANDNHNINQIEDIGNQLFNTKESHRITKKPGLYLSHGEIKPLSRTVRSQSLRIDGTNWSSDLSQSCTVRSSFHGSLEQTDKICGSLSIDYQVGENFLGRHGDNSFTVSESTTRTGQDQSKQQLNVTGKPPLGFQPRTKGGLQPKGFGKQGIACSHMKSNQRNDFGQKGDTNETGDNQFEFDQTLDLVSVTSMSPTPLVNSPSVQVKSDLAKKFGPFRLGRRYSTCFPLIRGNSENSPKSCLTRLNALRKSVVSQEKKAHRKIHESDSPKSGHVLGKQTVRIVGTPVTCTSQDDDMCGTCCSGESINHVNLLIHSMRAEQSEFRKQYKLLYDQQIALSKDVQQLHTQLSASREIGLKLEAANGRYISESLKHKYLMTERAQLQLEIGSRKKVLETKEIEKRELQLELDRLQRLKTYSERQYQDALMQSNFTNQQLRDVSEKCSNMEQYTDEGSQLCKMMHNLQDVVGRIRVIVSLKPTVQESCLTYLNSTELTFTPPSPTADGDSRQFDKIRQPNSPHSKDEPVLCQLSHVVSPGSCAPLEIYNELSNTIDGVSNGLHALFVSTGPIQAGKTTTMFGGQIPLNGQSDLLSVNPHTKRWISTWKEKRANLKLMAKFNVNMFIELVHSEEFATCYGLLGLCLLHLVQNVQLKAILHIPDEDGAKRLARRITVSALTIPLMDSLPEFDILANRFIKCVASDGVNLLINEACIVGEKKLIQIPCELKEYPIDSLSDVITVCESIQHRLQSRNEMNSAITAEPIGSVHTVSAHTVILIRIHSALSDEKSMGLYSNNYDSNNHRNGLLILIDTVGLDGDSTSTTGFIPSAYNAVRHQALNAWKDVAALTQMIRINPNPIWFERNRLLFTIKSYMSPYGTCQTNRRTDCCTLILHLPCDQQQAYTTMQCLRLGLWVMQMNRNQKERGRVAGQSPIRSVCLAIAPHRPIRLGLYNANDQIK